jgi:anti-sigma regulatory factor (Ser/Thr protein kinase)
VAPGHAAWQVELLLSELVTNAVMHARTRFSVVLTRANAVLRCEVTDASPLAPEPRRTPTAGQTGGRGLLLVESVASRWGVQRHQHGKTVWFDLSLGPSAQPAH